MANHDHDFVWLVVGHEITDRLERVFRGDFAVSAAPGVLQRLER